MLKYLLLRNHYYILCKLFKILWSSKLVQMMPDIPAHTHTHMHTQGRKEERKEQKEIKIKIVVNFSNRKRN